MARARDKSRSAVYGAESQLRAVLERAAGSVATVDFFGSTLTVPAERRFGDVAAVQRYADAVLGLDQVRRWWPGLPPVRVRARRGSSAAHYEGAGVIAVPVQQRWAMGEVVVCHELSHHVVTHTTWPHRQVPGSGGTPPASLEPAHGPTFTETMCRIVGVAMADEVELLLRAGYLGAGVPVGAVEKGERR